MNRDRDVPVADSSPVVDAARQALEEMKAGLGRPADEVFGEIRREFSIPPTRDPSPTSDAPRESDPNREDQDQL